MTTPAASPRRSFDWLGGMPTVVLLLLLLIVAAYFALTEDAFASDRTLRAILRSSAWLVVVGVGTTLALGAGAVDFSIMSTAALCGIVSASLSASLSPVVGVPAGLAAGVAVGLANAFFVVRLRVNAFLATLVMGGVVRGLDFALGEGTRGVKVQDTFMADILTFEQGVLPLAFVVALAAAVAATFVVHRTPFGRGLLASGGNPAAARISGIRADRMVGSAYVISGLAAAVGGILLASRLGAGVPAAGTGQELTLYSAILIAGTPLWGGRANILGSVVAILLLTTLYTGLVLAGYPDRLQQIASGVLLLVSIWLVSRRTRAGISIRRRPAVT